MSTKTRTKTRPANIPFLMALLLAATAIAPATTSADTRGYEVSVEGLSCPFCVFGLEDRLKELPGVKVVTIDLGAGRARFKVAPGTTVLPSAVRAAVRDAGFTPGTIVLTATGAIRRSGSDFILVLDSSHSIKLRRGRAFSRMRGMLGRGPVEVTITGEIVAVNRTDVLRVDQVGRP